MMAALVILSATSCKKSTCVQCTKQVAIAQQTSTAYIEYSPVYIQFCGRHADTAMTNSASLYNAFIAEYGITPNTCFYTE
jgi:histone acetyltransferase (RNA polymerase elongator complex component)